MKKRFLAILLTLCMMLSLAPAAFAAETDPFTDVAAADWYYDEVVYAYEYGLMQGTSATTFSPDTTTSRAMIVTILYRLEDEPAVSAAGTFTDVAAGQYYTEAVEWAYANNIVGGYGNGLFGPTDLLTREQMAAILYRYADYKGYDVSVGENTNILSYADFSSISEYAIPAMQWACGEGLIKGTSDTTLSPAGTATRAQFAVILYRFCENVVEDAEVEEYVVTFEYNYGSKGAYKTVTVEDGETVSKPSNPTRSGYSFSGWYTKASGGSKFDFDTEIAADLTLYAHWSSNSGGGSSSGGNTHAHSYGEWASNGDGTHTKTCSNSHGTCDSPTVTENCSYTSITDERIYCVCGASIIENAVALLNGIGYATLEEAVAAVEGAPATITLIDDTEETQVKIPDGKSITVVGEQKTTAFTGQFKVTGELTLKDMTVKTPTDAVLGEVSQYSKSAIALMNTGDVTCIGVTFEMKDGVNDATAITAYWSTGDGTQIVVEDCIFNCDGERPIRSDANVTVTGSNFNDPYRYAVQLTSKSSTMDADADAYVVFENNKIYDGENGKDFVYGVQLEGADYGCSDLTITGSGNAIYDENDEGNAMYYCECGMIDHDTIKWNTEVAPVHDDGDYKPEAFLNGVEYMTLDNALQYAKEGDTIQLAAGTLTRTQSISVSTDNLTIKGMGENTTTVTGSGDKVTQGLFYVFASGVTIQDMTINYTGNDNQTSAIKVTQEPSTQKTAADFTAKNLTVSSTGGHGINLSFVDGISVMENVTVSSCVKMGLYFRCASAEITNCNIAGGTSWNKGIGCEVAASDTEPSTAYTLSVDDNTTISASTAKLDLNTGGHQVSYNLKVPVGWISTTSGTNILYN